MTCRNRGGAIVDSQLLVDVNEVGLDRRFADERVGSDPLVGRSPGSHDENLPLLLAECVTAVQMC